jgi:hypothetical protein
VATLVVAAVTVLSSCSTSAPSANASTSAASADVIDPSVPSATPSATPTETIASDAPAAAATPVATSDPTATTDSRTAVVPYITTADWDSSAQAVDVAAIVPGVVESGGTCTVTLTEGSTVRTLTTDGVAASSYTGCEAVVVKDLAAGSWQVRVRYSSSKSAGASAVRTVQVG